MPRITNAQWADAIAKRIADEWSGRDDCPEDAELLESVLSDVFRRSPDACHRLIGTGIIEEGYFDPLD